MLDTDTKRRIDSARDILVGKVPDPKSQVEQITIALIYKFMDDMDAEAEELGGKRKFFTGDFARYGWAKLMRSGLGGHETLALYGEGITKMTENPGLPSLFRDIFKNAYLPYRDPETLTPVEYYFKMPPDISQRDIIVVDPMLATGNSAAAAISRIKSVSPLSIKFVCLIASPEGLSIFHQEHPDVHVFTASIDEKLNDHGYIIPGLGDAGDRIYGTK